MMILILLLCTVCPDVDDHALHNEDISPLECTILASIQLKLQFDIKIFSMNSFKQTMS